MVDGIDATAQGWPALHARVGDTTSLMPKKVDATTVFLAWKLDGEAHGIICIVRRLVRPGHLDDEVAAAAVYGRELVRAADEPEEAFIDRARQLAHSLKPDGHGLAALTFE